jgi:hypothetical protein
MRESNEDGFDTRLDDINRLCELGFISWEERGIRVHEVLLQEISDELEKLSLNVT